MSTFTLSGNDLNHVSSTLPIYDSGFRFWRCKDANGVDFNVVDANGDAFVVTGTSPLPMLTPTAFYMAFTLSEMRAIKSSADENVIEFFARWKVAYDANEPINPNLISVTEGLEYLAAPVSPGSGAGILSSPERIAQILAGVPQ